MIEAPGIAAVRDVRDPQSVHCVCGDRTPHFAVLEAFGGGQDSVEIAIRTWLGTPQERTQERTQQRTQANPLKASTKVECLQLSGCQSLSEQLVFDAVVCCQHLQVLNLRGVDAAGTPECCAAIGRLSHLRVLDLASVTRLNDLSLCALASGMADSSGTPYGDSCVDSRIQSYSRGSQRRDAGTVASRQASRQAESERPRCTLMRLNLSTNKHIGDAGLRAVGRRFRGSLLELCLYGCYLVTDRGIVAIASQQLARINYCGCYKVTSEGRRSVLSQNNAVIIFNKASQFGGGIRKC